MPRIEISVDSDDRQRIDFLISKTMPLFKVMQAYADYYGINRSTLAFRLRGLKIRDSDTARLLNMRAGDIIKSPLEVNKEDITSWKLSSHFSMVKMTSTQADDFLLKEYIKYTLYTLYPFTD